METTQLNEPLFPRETSGEKLPAGYFRGCFRGCFRAAIPIASGDSEVREFREFRGDSAANGLLCSRFRLVVILVIHALTLLAIFYFTNRPLWFWNACILYFSLIFLNYPLKKIRLYFMPMPSTRPAKPPPFPIQPCLSRNIFM